MFKIYNNQVFISQILTALGPLRETFNVFIPLGIWCLLKATCLQDLQNKITFNQSFKRILEQQESNSW